MKHIGYIRKMLFVGIVCILALSGCISDNDFPFPNSRIEVMFSINIPGSSTPDTRALGNGEENEVQTIEMLLFDPETDRIVGNPVFADNISTDAGDITKKTFSVLLPEGLFDVIIFANAREAFNATVITAGDGQEETLAKLNISMPVTGWATNPADVNKKYLIPMWGMKENLSIGQNTSISGIWLHRMVSRIDLLVTGDNEFTGDFKLKDIKLYNVQQQGRVAPAIANWNAAGKINGITTAGLAVSPSMVPDCGVHPAISYASAISVDKKGCEGEIYLFEAPKATGHADPNAPFLTVKGEFEGVEGWYRIDLADYDDMSYIDVLRNHRYRIHIERVSGIGFPEEEDAINNRGENIIVDITLWNEYDMGGTVFNGQHFLSINPQEMELTTYAHSGVSFTIKTDLDSEISLSGIKLSGSPSDPNSALAGNWITGLSLSQKNVVGDKNVYTFSFDVADNGNGDGENRIGYIYVTCGRLTNVVRIEQLSIDLAALVGLQVVGAVEVPAVGGESGLIELVGIPTAMESKLSMRVSFATMSGIALDGRALVHHDGILVDENGNAFDPGMSYPVTQRFRVRFPKIYYPNREITGITGVVTVTLSDGTTKAYSISQKPLIPKAMQAHNYKNGAAGWGIIINWDSYCVGIINALNAIPDFNVTGTTSAINSDLPVPAGTNYLHTAFNGDSRATTLTYHSWDIVNTWRSNNDGLLMLTAQQVNGTSLLNYEDYNVTGNTSPLKQAGYPDAVHNSTPPAIPNFTSGNVHKIYESSSTKKVYQYIMQHAVHPISANSLTTDIYGDTERSTMPISELPASAVVMVYHPNVDRATLIIDVENRFIYCGEMSHFEVGQMSGNRDKFTQNLVKYMENVTRYGSHFTDLLIENGRPGAKPAPWDSYWGANAME